MPRFQPSNPCRTGHTSKLWGILDRMPARVPDRCRPVMIVIKQLTRAVILVMAAVFIGVLLSR